MFLTVTLFVFFEFLAGIVTSLHAHGKTSATVAGEVFLCIVNLTYLNADLLAVNGRLFGEVGACSGK